MTSQAFTTDPLFVVYCLRNVKVPFYDAFVWLYEFCFVICLGDLLSCQYLMSIVKVVF